MSLLQVILVFFMGVGVSFAFISPEGVSAEREKLHPVKYSAIVWGFFVFGSLPTIAVSGLRSEVEGQELRSGDVFGGTVDVSPKVQLETFNAVNSQALVPLMVGMLAGYIWIWLKASNTVHINLKFITIDKDIKYKNIQKVGYIYLVMGWWFFWSSFR